MSPEETLAALRAGGAAAERAKVALAHTGEPNEREEHTRLCAEVARLLAGSLRPGDREIARWLLEHEIATHEAAGHGAREALYTLIAAVARYADPDDALLIWRARTATPETRAGVDVEQAARAGVERVRRRLRALVAAGGPRSARGDRCAGVAGRRRGVRCGERSAGLLRLGGRALRRAGGRPDLTHRRPGAA